MSDPHTLAESPAAVSYRSFARPGKWVAVEGRSQAGGFCLTVFTAAA